MVISIKDNGKGEGYQWRFCVILTVLMSATGALCWGVFTQDIKMALIAGAIPLVLFGGVLVIALFCSIVIVPLLYLVAKISRSDNAP